VTHSGPPRIAIAVLVAALATAGCGPIGSPPPSGGPLAVVATTTVFADLVANVGGPLVSVTSLVPRNGDVHTFAPSPADVRRVAESRLIVMNGLGLDEWLQELIKNAAADETPIIELAEDLPGVELIEGGEEEAGAPDGPDHGAYNPHLWLAVPYAILYVDRIEAALAAADPANAAAYAAGADAYAGRLRDLDARVRAEIDTIPAASRRIVTFHDAFPYFAREYGIEVVGVAVEAPGQEPSAAQIAALVEAIRGAGVRAIFSETQFPSELVRRIAAETAATVVADLYTDSLGDPPVTSYEAVIEWDVARLVEALR
jgi:ABC-type Zn uptake system ZnuABC Zn-binding protein ZnuA